MHVQSISKKTFNPPVQMQNTLLCLNKSYCRDGIGQSYFSGQSKFGVDIDICSKFCQIPSLCH